MTTLPRLALALIIALGTFTGCGDAPPRPRQPPDTSELLRQQEEERRRERQLLEQRKWTAKQYAHAAGKQIMNEIGGGQDLVVDVTGWSFNPVGRQYEIDMQISFNGAIVRSNNYRAAGRLTVNEDGSAPQFSRTGANQNFQDQEGLLTGLKIGVLILDELSKE